MEPLELIRNTCGGMDSMNRETAVLETLVNTVCEMENVDFAGVYLPESASGEFTLEVIKGLPDWFVSSFGRVPASFLPDLEFDQKGDPHVYPTGVFPLHTDDSIGMLMFTASHDPKISTEESHEQLQWLAWSAWANLRRIRATDSFQRSLNSRTVLLDRIMDPVAALDSELDLIFCNRAFRQLTRLEEQDGSPITFREASGKEFFGLVETGLREVIDSGESSSLVCEYADRIFSVTMHPAPEGPLVIMRDVTEEEITRRKLNFREKFEGLLVSIATDFIEMQGTALNLGIHDALLSIGVAVEVDRAYLFQFSEDQGTMSNTHEWCASNIQPQIDRLQGLRASDYPWWMNRLNMHETIHVQRISDLPEWAEAERELMEEKDVQSILVVPIVHGNTLIGFLGFDSVSQDRRWTEDIVDLLRIVGDAIGNALERNRMEKAMMRMYRKAEKEAQVNDVLLREVNHRVKNNLSEIIGLLYAQKRFTTGDYNEFIHNLTGRIRGLATVHDLLSRSGWKPLELTGLARGIVESAITGAHERKKLTSSVSSSSITVNANQAHALALILNELVRNSIKHALTDRESLRIKVRMRKERSGRVNLTYCDDGPGYPEDVINLERKNLGLDLIQNLIIKNLQGDLILLNDGGAAARISFSLEPPGEEANEEE